MRVSRVTRSKKSAECQPTPPRQFGPALKTWIDIAMVVGLVSRVSLSEISLISVVYTASWLPPSHEYIASQLVGCNTLHAEGTQR
jgi:hypothetical protein